MDQSAKSQPSAKHSSGTSSVTEDKRLQAEAAYRWGKTPSSNDKQESDPAKVPADHAVHKFSQKEQEKMRRNGVNPVLKAEMDEATKGHGREAGFWGKVGLNATGGWRR